MQSRHLRAAVFAGSIALAGLAPSVASAHHVTPASFFGPHRISIHAQPDPIVVGDSVVIYGRLFGRNDQDRLVVLYHRPLDGGGGFVPVQTTRTGPGGVYEFSRADGRVDSSRQWYVASAGADSRVVTERVAGLVTVNVTGPNGQSEPDGAVLYTGRGYVYTFSGNDDPGKLGARVLLQRQSSSRGLDDWVTIGRGTLDANGNYSIAHSFVIPSETGGDADVRIFVPNDGRNIGSPSETLNYEIEQTQNAALTIVPSAYVIDEGQSDSITGVDAQGAGRMLTLWSHTVGEPWAQVATTTTTTAGDYAFSVFPTSNTYYRVNADPGAVAGRRNDTGPTGTTGGSGSTGSSGGSGSTGSTGSSGGSGSTGSTGKGHGGPNLPVSAVAFVGVRVVMTLQTTPTTINQGQSVTFSGSLNPDETGRTIYLERLNDTGTEWHVIASNQVGANSQYSLTQQFFVPGSETVRVAIPGSPVNQGTATAPVTITIKAIPTTALVPAGG